MQEILEKIKEKYRHIGAYAILLVLLTYIQPLKILYILLSYAITVLSITKIWSDRKTHKNLIVLGFSELSIISFAWLLGHSSSALLAYSSMLLFLYTVWNSYVNNRPELGCEVIQAAIMSLYVISSFNSHAWEFSYVILLFFYSFAIIALLTCCIGFKPAVFIYYLSSVLFEVVSVFFHNYRYSNITISDVLSLPTFFNVASNYTFQWDDTMTVFAVMGIMCVIPFFFMNSYKPDKRFRIVIASTFVASITFLGLGYKTSVKWQKENCGTNYFDIFAMSVIDEIKIKLDTPDMDGQVAKVKAFPSDTWEDGAITPNIVTVMCESYSDIVKIRDLIASEDPVDPLWELGETDSHAQTGTVHINTAGGGTSVSEWEYQTGLNHSLLSVSRVPFFTDCKKNYTFSADTLYSNYYKLYMHPYKSSGWNRTNVYQAFQFDEMVFSEPGDETYGAEDRVRGIVSDKAFLNTIKKRLEESDKPLFSMNVTMQNHGGYGDNVGGEDRLKEKTVTVSSDIKDKELTENFLTLEKLSTEAILEFTQYLKEHPEEPTLLIFFGDHYPSDLEMPVAHTSYGTPYLVYSNFCELQDMPEEMDLSLLYANAMKAAGLPLSSWDKYLLSLNGKTADRSMIIARIKGGYF